jgi:AraC-like DNA-binding protein
MAVDALSEVLRLVRLNGAVFLDGQFSAPWNVQSPPSKALAAAVLPEAEHVIVYHLIAEGSCYIRLSNDAPVQLEEGDVVMLPHGDAHRMSSQPRFDTPLMESVAYPRAGEITSLRCGGGGTLTRVVCGYLALDRKLCGSLISALPPILRVSARSTEVGAWLRTYVRISADERGEERPGGRCVLAKLSELMFVETVRRYVEGLPPGQRGWLAGLRDPYIGRALGLLHASPSRQWTVELLAREIGLSRSALAERFTELIGQPPMQYLTQWRLLLAAHVLQTTTRSAAVVAEEVGYDSESAFSRAFRREFGLPPATWRRKGRTDVAMAAASAAE